MSVYLICGNFKYSPATLYSDNLQATHLHTNGLCWRRNVNIEHLNQHTPFRFQEHQIIDLQVLLTFDNQQHLFTRGFMNNWMQCKITSIYILMSFLPSDIACVALSNRMTISLCC